MTHQLDLPDLADRRTWIQDAAEKIEWNFAGRPFCSDDVHTFLGRIPQPNWTGAAIALLKRTGKIEEIGRVRSARASANGRKVSLFGWRKST